MNMLSQNNLFLLLQFVVIDPCFSVKALKALHLPRILLQTCVQMQTSVARDSQQHSQQVQQVVSD